MKYAGIAESEEVRGEVDAELDDRPACYEVDLYVSGAELEYAVDAYSGKVIRGAPVAVSGEPAKVPADAVGTGTEKTAVAQKPAVEKAPAGETKPPEKGDIGSDGAKSAALAHAGLAESQVTRLQVEKDREDGRTVYEVDFRNGNTEYEYTVDAATGSVLEHEVDRDD